MHRGYVHALLVFRVPIGRDLKEAVVRFYGLVKERGHDVLVGQVRSHSVGIEPCGEVRRIKCVLELGLSHDRRAIEKLSVVQEPLGRPEVMISQPTQEGLGRGPLWRFHGPLN